MTTLHSNPDTERHPNGKRAARYKFDQVWKDAIAATKLSQPIPIEEHIRAYIEGDASACDLLYGTPFHPAWILIKAKIDRRKARNARARERRQQRRAEQAAAAQTASAQATSAQANAASAPTMQEHTAHTTTAPVKTRDSDPHVYDNMGRPVPHIPQPGAYSTSHGYYGTPDIQRSLPKKIPQAEFIQQARQQRGMISVMLMSHQHHSVWDQ